MKRIDIKRNRIAIISIIIIAFLSTIIYFLMTFNRNMELKINDEIDIVVLADRENPRDINGSYEKLKPLVKNRRIDFVGINCAGKKKSSLMSYPYPYTQLENSDPPALRNLVGNSDGTMYRFVNRGDRQDEYISLEIKKDYPKIAYEISKTTSSAASKIRSWVNWNKSEKAIEKKYEITINPCKSILGSNFEDTCFTDINSYGDIIMMNSGLTILTYKGTVFPSYNKYFMESLFEYNGKKVELKDVIFDFPYIFGAVFLDDKTIVYQAPGKEEKSAGNKLKLNINVLIFYSTDGVKTNRIIESGFSPITPVYVENHICPLDISPDKKMVAFLSCYQVKSKRYPELWLSVWSVETNRIDKILSVNSDLSFGTSLIWCPDKNSPLIALTMDNSLKIIDYRKKRIIKSFPNIDIKNARWSPDGSKIAFLTCTKYIANGSPVAPELKAEKPACLWVYNIRNDKLERIAEDADYFDFFWVR